MLPIRSLASDSGQSRRFRLPNCHLRRMTRHLALHLKPPHHHRSHLSPRNRRCLNFRIHSSRRSHPHRCFHIDDDGAHPQTAPLRLPRWTVVVQRKMCWKHLKTRCSLRAKWRKTPRWKLRPFPRTARIASGRGAPVADVVLVSSLHPASNLPPFGVGIHQRDITVSRTTFPSREPAEANSYSCTYSALQSFYPLYVETRWKECGEIVETMASEWRLHPAQKMRAHNNCAPSPMYSE
jgi:hypothetical protein